MSGCMQGRKTSSSPKKAPPTPKAARGMWSNRPIPGRGSSTQAAPPPAIDKNIFEVGELVLYGGERVIYRIKKRTKADRFSSRQYDYTIKEVLDPLRHPGDDEDDEGINDHTNVGATDMARVTLVELGTMRLKLDTFIQEEVKRLRGDA